MQDERWKVVPKRLDRRATHVGLTHPQLLNTEK